MSDRRRRDVLALSGAGLAALAGCTGGGGADPADDEGSEEEEADGSDGGDAGEDWRTATLEDVATGESFALDAVDVPVVLHSFALWCGSCRTQHVELDAFFDGRGGGRWDGDRDGAGGDGGGGRTAQVVGVDLNVDENEDAADVAAYVQEHGYDWHFAVAPARVTRGLVDEFGERMAVAPQSPVVVVCPDGDHHVHDDVVTEAGEIDASVDGC